MLFALLLILAAFCSPVPGQTTESAESLRRADISAADIATAQHFAQSLSIADWLGPLAPVALSPFFGIACLSGITIYGQGWAASDNPLLGTSSPLNSQVIFWTFVTLTLVTSLPRLTKVSKPFAQAVDQIEAWAGIITMITLKMMLGAHAPELSESTVVELGLVSFTADSLLMVAAVINIFVINTVRFFFEVLIWITPVPTIDAIFEFTNKSACAILVAIYAYSPALATGINLAIFFAAGIVFTWSHRREIFFRTMLIDALLTVIFPAKAFHTKKLTVFPASAIGPFPARARCKLQVTDSGWTLTQHRILRGPVRLELSASESAMELDSGYFTNCLTLTGRESARFTFSRRYHGCLPDLANAMKITFNRPTARVDRNHSEIKAEMAS